MAAPPTSYVPISEAAEKVGGYDYRYVRRLIAEGKVKALATHDHHDGRVRLLVSTRSLAAYKRSKKRRSA